MINKTPGKVHDATVTSTVSGLDETFEVQYYLPKNYSDLYKHKVIITFDSQDFFKYGQIERQYEKLYEVGEIERCIIVGIPYPSVEWRNRYFSPNGDKHKQFVQFVATDFINWVDKNFATLRTGTARLLFGESLAGSMAYSVALQYPTTFSQAAAFSPFVDDGFIEKFEAQPMLINLNLYHTIGLEEEDFTTIMGNQADFLTPNRALNDYLSGEGCEYEYVEMDGGHIWKTWKPEISTILQYYFE